MLAPWVLDLTEKPATNRYRVDRPREDAHKPERESARRPRRGYREPEDDPRAEFVGAYLDRAI